MYHGHEVLDVHGHVNAPLSMYSTSLLMLAANQSLPSPVRVGSLGPVMPWDIGELEANTELHVAELDRRSIDAQLIGPQQLMQFGWMPSHLIPAAVEVSNDLIAAQCNFAPDRFLGAAQLPQQAEAPDSGHMVAELNRCIDDLGFVAVSVCPDPTGTRTTPGLHTAYWDPVYARAAHYDIPILVHTSGFRDPRAEGLPFNYQIGIPIEQYLARELVSRSNLFDRHPALRMMVVFCGGMLDRAAPTDDVLGTRARLRGNLFFDTCAHDADFLALAIRQHGPESMCFGSEVPTLPTSPQLPDGRWGDDLVPVIDSFDWLGAEEKLAILHHNPLRFCPGFQRLL